MALEQELQNFWNSEIMPRFTERALESRVRLLDGREVRYVNLDNAATTKPFKAVKERLDSEADVYGSVHRGAGRQSKQTTEKYENARDTIRRFVGASSDNYVTFTLNTTGAINQAAALFSNKQGYVLVSDIEHSSNLLPWKGQLLRVEEHGFLQPFLQYRREHGFLQYRTNKDGTINTLGEIENAIRTNFIKLLAVTGSSNVTGYKPPIYEIAELVHSHKAQILVDVCQLIPHEKVDMLPDENPRHLDFIAFSGHKMYAPYGVGVLVGPKIFFDSVRPYQLGGGNLSYISSDLELIRPHLERDHDAGTPNALGVFALEEAINQLTEVGMENIKNYEQRLVGLALKGLREIKNVKIYLSGEYATTIPFEVEGMPYKLVAEVLDSEYGIGTRAGAFCTYELMRKFKDVSPEEDKQITKEVKRGITANIPGVVRASFSISNNHEDVRRLIDAAKEISENGHEHYKGSYIMNPATGDWLPR